MLEPTRCFYFCLSTNPRSILNQHPFHSSGPLAPSPLFDTSAHMALAFIAHRPNNPLVKQRPKNNERTTPYSQDCGAHSSNHSNPLLE